jgi:DNA repair protein RecO
LDLITEAQTLEGFANLRKNLNRVRIAYLLCELVDKLTPENQEHEAVYDLLCGTLSLLNRDTASNNLIFEFEKNLLQLLGFGLPRNLDRDSLEAHILTITEKPLSSKKLR